MARAHRWKGFSWTTSLLVLGFALLGATHPAQAGLLGLWQLNEGGGTVAPNSVPGGTNGTLYEGASVGNGPVWTFNDDRGVILSFDGNNDFVDAGFIPALSLTDDFTWTFWARANQGPNSEVILGNRKDAANTDAGGWVKFTGTQFEFRGTSAHNNLDYVDIPSGGAWIHHAMVKSGNQLTYYRDGVASGTATLTTAAVAQPFYFGGDKYTEYYNVWLDNVATFNHALSQAEVQAVMNGDFSAYGIARPTGMSDSFGGTSLDTSKWLAINKGLQSTADGGYNPPAVGGGTLTLAGTTTGQYWLGKSVVSTERFDVPAGGEVKFDVDRVSLTGTGSAYRSSMWMYGDATHYLHFAQNIGENGWQYNAGNNAPTGGGNNLARADSLDGDGGLHKMTLVHDGAYVKMFVDGRWIGSQAADFNQFSVLLTGQARAIGDTVSAVFDNAAVTTRTYLPVFDNFNSGAIDPAKWTVIPKGLENQGIAGSMTAGVENGELVIQGSTGQQYWYGLTLKSVQTYSPTGPWTFAVDRDALTLGGGGAIGRSGLWIWADDNHFLFFGQNLGENGWQYNYADGLGVGVPTGSGVNIGAFDALDGDPGSHELKVFVGTDGAGGTRIDMYLDGQLGASQVFNNWGSREFNFMLSAMPRASGDSVFVAFDNVQVMVPEPGACALLGVGGLLLGLCWPRRRGPRQVGNLPH